MNLILASFCIFKLQSLLVVNEYFDLDKTILKKFRQSLLLNKKVIDHPGKKFYYSPQTTKLSLAFLIITICLNVYLAYNSDKFEEVALFIIGTLLCGNNLVNILHKVILKTPIFIINGDQLFYTKMDKWFDLNTTIIYKDTTGKYNFWGTLIIEQEYWNDPIHENLWYIEYDKDFIKFLKKYFKKKV